MRSPAFWLSLVVSVSISTGSAERRANCGAPSTRKPLYNCRPFGRTRPTCRQKLRRALTLIGPAINLRGSVAERPWAFCL
jgi:hypothetical protein